MAAVDLVLADAAGLALHTGARDPQAAVRRLHAAGTGGVLVTLAARGALLVDAAGARHVPAPPVSGVDTTGAGDLLAGTFTGLVERGVDRETALRVAVAAPSRETTHPGTVPAFPQRAEIDALLAASAAA